MSANRINLYFAAKAAGLKILSDPDGLPRNCTGMDPAMDIYSAPVWNPIEKSGDALRLAVQLNILSDPIFIHEREVLMFTQRMEKLEATRLAIVRAAAQIGESMQLSASLQNPPTSCA